MASRPATGPAGTRKVGAGTDGTRRPASVARKTRPRKAQGASPRQGPQRSTGVRATSRRGNGKPTTSVTLMRVRELDPQTTCGPRTTVLQLFRVDDPTKDRPITHLVFLDRHGWYCEHGRDCPAVAAVRKHARETS